MSYVIPITVIDCAGNGVNLLSNLKHAKFSTHRGWRLIFI